MWQRITRLLGMGVAAVVGLCACQLAYPTSMSGDHPVSAVSTTLSLSLVISDVYCKDSACSCVHYVATRRYTDFFRRLREQYGIIVTPVYFEDGYQVEKQIREGKVDGVVCKPWLGLSVARIAGRNIVRIADLEDIHKNTQLWGMFVVPKDSPLRTLADAAGKRFAFGQPCDYEKYYAAFDAMEKAGIPIPVSTARMEKASCIESLGAIMDKKADVAVISHYALSSGCAVDFTSPEEFRVIGETEKIPFISLMLDRDRVSEDNIRRVKNAVIKLSREALPESMSGGGFVKITLWNPAELDGCVKP